MTQTDLICPTRTVPGTDIAVSTVCVGTMTFGNPVETDDAVALVHRALDHGVNFIDTADMYEGYDRFLGSPGGVAESILGKALRGRRDRAIITTKVGNAVGDGSYEGAGLSPGHIHHQVDTSLSRLETDRIDFYELHRPDPDTPLEDSIGAMVRLIEAGKVRHWGFSNFEAGDVDRMIEICAEHGWPPPAISQPRVSWLKPEALAGHVPTCAAHRIGVTPYQPLEGGWLTGKYRRSESAPDGTRASESKWLETPDNSIFDRIEEFAVEARRASLTPAQYAIKWLLDKPGITAAVVGVKRADQLHDAIAGALASNP